MKQPVYKNMGVMYFTWHQKKTQTKPTPTPNQQNSLSREFMIQHEGTSVLFPSLLSQSSYKQVITSLTRLLDTRNVRIECV